MEKTDNRKRFVNSTSWQIVQNIYTMLVSLIVGSLSARYLGPSYYGLLNYGASLIAFFSSLCELGMESMLVAEMIRKPDKQGSYIGTIVVMRLTVSVISFIAIWILLIVLEPNNTLLHFVTLLQATVLIVNTYQVLLYWFQMNLEMKYISIATMVAATVTGVWRISLLITGQSVEYFAFTESIAAIVTGAIIVIAFYRKKHPSLSVSIKDGKYLLWNSYHFIVSGLAVTLYLQLDRVMLGKWVSNEAVGYYSVASTIVTIWEFAPMALINSARPILLRKYQTSKEDFLYHYKILLASINVLGLLVGLGITAFGRTIIMVLYGEKYLTALPTMIILVWSTSFAVIGSARSIWIVAEGKNKYSKYYVIIGAVVNAVLNAAFIPRWGITAAATTTLCTQIIVAIIAPVLYQNTREFAVIYFDSFKYIKYVGSLASSEIKKIWHVSQNDPPA